MFLKQSVKTWGRFFPAGVLLFGVCLLYIADYRISTLWEHHEQEQMASRLQLIKTRLEGSIASRFQAVMSISSLFETGIPLKKEQFNRFSKNLMEFNSPIRALQYANEETQVIYSFPEKRNEIVLKKPMVLIKDPARGPYVKKAIAERRATLQGPYLLRQGGLGVVVRCPIFNGEQFLGLAIGVYDLAILLKEALDGMVGKQYTLSLKDPLQGFFWGVSITPLPDSMHIPVYVMDKKWEVFLNRAEAAPYILVMRLALWLLGLLFFIFLAYRFWIQQKRELYLSELEQHRLAQLNEAKETLDLTSMAALMGGWSLNVKRKRVSISNEVCLLLGMKDTARSMDIEEFCSWFQQHENLYSRLEECIGEGSSIDMELRLKEGLEGEQWLHLVGVLKNGASQIQGVLRDISRAKIAEEERKKSEENYRITLNSIGDAVIATDTEGQVTHMNPVAEALTGWTSKEAFGRRLQEVFHIVNETTRLPVSDPVTRVLSTGELVTLENHTVLISKDGKEYLIGDSGAPIFNSERKIIGVVLVFRDMTAEYKTQEELLKVQKLQSVGNLAGGIAHDFNNILTGIYANLDLALANITPGHGAYSYLHEMEKSVDRAKSLATQLLTFSKGGLPLREVVRLKELIESTIRFDLSGSNVQAEIICNDEIWPVEADRGQLAQVFSNLILNASQAMKDGGTIRVTLENVSFEDSEIHKNLNGKFVKIKFRDSGCGIPESILHQIFDPFFTTKSEGTGLGLAVVYSIVERHGGKVEVNSLVNEGTEFTVYIPADENMELMEIPVENLHGESEREEGVKVLVIDDEEMVREVTESMLEFLGYGFDSALNTKEGIAKFNKALEEGEPFKIVITDLTIPGEKGGQDTARILTEIDPSVSVIVTSGYSDGPVMARFKEYGFKGRLVKPFIRAELDAMLQEILHK